jgi:hypothetical protein
MKMKRFLFSVLLASTAAAAEEVSSSSAPVRSTAPFSWRREPNKAFAVGESLKFVIKYGFVTGGHATLEIRSTETVKGRTAYFILSEAKTTSGLDVFFKVRDKNESRMDVESLCSLSYHQDMNEGRYHRKVWSDYDHPAGRFAYKKERKGKESVQEGEIPPFVHDVLTSLYYIRTKDLVPHDEILLQVNSGAQTWPLKVLVKEVEKVKVPAGTFECIRVEPLIAGEGLFMQTGNLEVWMTRDDRHMPVQLRSKVMVGAFTGELEEYTLPSFPLPASSSTEKP